MLTWSNTTTSGGAVAPTPSAATLTAQQGGLFVWNATAMNLDSVSLLRNPATRTSSECYMRGLKDNLRIQTNTGNPWFHRRVCVAHRGPSPLNTFSVESGQPNPFQTYVDTSNGIERLLFNWNNNSTQGTNRDALYGLLFKGTQGVDWNDAIIAPLDNSRVDVKFDKTWKLLSGNASGVVRERKMWHPMNKTLVYDDDENGETEVSSYLSTSSKRGMGDYYVIDFIASGIGGTSSDLMVINANSTLYWHEK